jgi:hypothetical protein
MLSANVSPCAGAFLCELQNYQLKLEDGGKELVSWNFLGAFLTSYQATLCENSAQSHLAKNVESRLARFLD